MDWGDEKMEIAAVVGIGLIGMVLAVLLRQYKPEYAAVFSLGVGVLIFFMLVSDLLPVFDELENLLAGVSLSADYIAILVKSLGVCYLTQLASDACKDAGENAIGGKVELAGKVAVLYLGLPMFRQLLEIVRTLIF